MEAVMVEVYSRLGQVRFRQKLTTFPATLGRGLDCDVILEETDVSAAHARVVRADDGSLVLEDLKSRNGVRLRRKRIDRITLTERTEVRLGSARVRFVSLSARPEKTVILQISRLDRLSVAVGVMAANVGLTVLADGVLPATRVRSSEVLSIAISILLFAACWAFGWALATRVTQGHFRYLGHLSAAQAMMLAAGLLDRVPSLIGFTLRLSPTTEWSLTAAGLCSAAAWMLWQHLVRVTSWSERRAAMVAAAIALAAGGLAILSKVKAAQKYSAELPLAGRAHPPVFLIGPVDPPSAAVEAIADLQRQVDRLRAER